MNGLPSQGEGNKALQFHDWPNPRFPITDASRPNRHAFSLLQRRMFRDIDGVLRTHKDLKQALTGLSNYDGLRNWKKNSPDRYAVINTSTEASARPAILRLPICECLYLHYSVWFVLGQMYLWMYYSVYLLHMFIRNTKGTAWPPTRVWDFASPCYDSATTILRYYEAVCLASLTKICRYYPVRTKPSY